MTFWFRYTPENIKKVLDIRDLLDGYAMLGTDSFAGGFYLDVFLPNDVQPIRDLLKDSGVEIQKES